MKYLNDKNIKTNTVYWQKTRFIWVLTNNFKGFDMKKNKVIRPKSRASALSKKSGRQTDEQTKTFKKTFELATKSLKTTSWQTNEEMDGWTDGQMDGWTDGQTDG